MGCCGPGGGFRRVGGALLCLLARGDQARAADQRQAAQHGGDPLNRLAPIDSVDDLVVECHGRRSDQRVRRLSSFTAKSAARAVNAMYVSDGFGTPSTPCTSHP